MLVKSLFISKLRALVAPCLSLYVLTLRQPPWDNRPPEWGLTLSKKRS